MKPASDEEKAKARRVAFLASRTNTMLSIPMVFFMAPSFGLSLEPAMSVVEERNGQRLCVAGLDGACLVDALEGMEALGDFVHALLVDAAGGGRAHAGVVVEPQDERLDHLNGGRDCRLNFLTQSHRAFSGFEDGRFAAHYP